MNRSLSTIDELPEFVQNLWTEISDDDQEFSVHFSVIVHRFVDFYQAQTAKSLLLELAACVPVDFVTKVRVINIPVRRRVHVHGRRNRPTF